MKINVCILALAAAVACAATLTPTAVLPINPLEGCHPATSLRSTTFQAHIGKGQDNISPSIAHPQTVEHDMQNIHANTLHYTRVNFY
jgi:hypothetical protein